MNSSWNFIDSLAGKLDRTGDVGNNISVSFVEAVQYFDEQMGKLNQYDLSYPGSRDEFIHTEIFNNCLMFKTVDKVFNSYLVAQIREVDRVFTPVMSPKYLQIVPESLPKKVCILPGSNLLKQLEMPYIHYLHTQGVYMKPHPVTMKYDLHKLKKFTDGKLMYEGICGVSCVKAADIVYSMSTSELGLIAKYLKKDVRILYPKDLHCGNYEHLYDNLSNLDIWLNSTASGIVRMTHYKEDIDGYIRHYNRHYNDRASIY